MFSVIVSTTKGTKVGEFQCIHSECQIGKDPSQLIVLRGLKISKNHATLRQDKNGIFIEDNKSITGLKVNDQRYKSYGPIATTDKIQVGDYQLRVHTSDPQYDAQSAPREAAGNSVHSGVPSPQEQSALVSIVPQAEKQQSSVIDHELIKKIKIRNEWRRKVHTELLKLMDLRRVNVNEMSDIELRIQSESLINQIIAGFSLPADIEVSSLVKEVLDETIGLGPLEALIADPDVSEIMVNSHDQIFYEKAGKLYLSDIAFSDDQAVLGAIERIVTPIGRRIDESSPMVDARLKDGSRVNAVIPPLALKGPCITIRKFMQRRLGCDDLVKFGSMNTAMASFLEIAVKQKRNIVISGGTGSGKTTLLNVLSNFIPDNERIVTVEDAAELQLYQPNLVSLEARPPNQEGKGAVEIRDLVKNCLRMRPDRVVIGECRGGEALDMLQAMNTGHDGSLTTAHSNSPRDCISRLEVMVMMAGMDLPVLAIREQITSAVNIIVQQSRFSDGSRRVTSICEVTGLEGSIVQLSEIFKFEQTGFNEQGKVQGYYTATGTMPEFYEQLRRQGVKVQLDIFDKEARYE
ncbi:Flp pilus assembly complex ATPase component TadA [Shewanella sp. SW36]|uniref:ATPase, T2SS/T4P/T4SS family n=1 Tax=unclassified Shewanella TaxID=196818 RepID=UPI0021D86C98|nr:MULTISPECIES: ATPase, T2SS/T4P/T4SS family [unclassified Shewanella]MCU7975294.1 Flp pilus assembly complex ATPase component TadA [Shewanella sp. SW36]MCU7990684.1 Flp pilus assembly complex ATPase component TadA [Shewanella sp. SW1]MCU8017597.1 Flp pilus assembly complex ATPase component TadA [Shewanella sp. SM72]MCU8051889.1 Flp pilus assembly complex ATPase component TadA [Shewanella sp. SM43]